MKPPPHTEHTEDSSENGGSGVVHPAQNPLWVVSDSQPRVASQTNGRVLVMTVGTGDITRREETLFVPLRKSIETESWTRVVLLPSSVTEELAEDLAQGLRTGLPGIDFAIEPLPRGAENNADSAYSHFDSILSTLVEHLPPTRVEVDFTRGTKAMSAALVLAATRWGIPQLRYIVGERDERGMVVPGTEQVRQIQTTAVEGHRRLDLARHLLSSGNFPAVKQVLDRPAISDMAPVPNTVWKAAEGIRSAAQFFAAWDRLAYGVAAEIPVPPPPAGNWANLWPTDTMREWVRVLAQKPVQDSHSAMAAWLRRLVIDLLANGERRVRQGQYEDALVRAYRVLEMIGQARLFDHGLDSGDLDPKHVAVRALQEELHAKGEHPLSQNPSGRNQAARLQAARLLRQCGDRLAKPLLKFESMPLLKPSLRNQSVLVHGFAARAPSRGTDLDQLFRDLEGLIEADDGDSARTRLSIARSLRFDTG